MEVDVRRTQIVAQIPEGGQRRMTYAEDICEPILLNLSQCHEGSETVLCKTSSKELIMLRRTITI